ncbi:GNAT family N-acetyltransferase [Massilia oculi]|uniref:GNAT family N-acetyltransferase n=1 Tax=Massilia hydrophila TaxID=3044279 RepID=A0ABS7Y952_9BURK|nr:GNAT family N-acetyltransferase [Massilia oculi]MCA1855597.1 GNAT family N-acetyltransferase [Massilia oculi]
MRLPEKLKAFGVSCSDHLQERKRLRGPAGLCYAIADSIAMLDRQAWQGLADGAGFFLSAAYLEALEDALPANLSPRYALVYQGEGTQRVPLAAVYMQIAEIGLAQAWPPEGAQVAVQARGALDKLAQASTQRVLTCGNLLSFGQHGVAFAPGTDPALGWHGLAEVLYRVRQAEQLAGKTHFIMIKDLHAPFTAHAASLKKLSYRYVETEPNMVLELDPAWRCHADYLASLASKYRGAVRNAVFGKIDAAGCTVESLSGLGPHQERLWELYKAVQARAAFRPFELAPHYFPWLERVAGQAFRCTVIRQGECLLGFLVSVADGETAYAYHIGFDRDAAATLPLYLRLLHAGIADAIGMGCKRISFGRTALEPKAALGARPQAFGVMVRHRQPVLNKAIKHLLQGIEHEEPPARNPFRTRQA